MQGPDHRTGTSLRGGGVAGCPVPGYRHVFRGCAPMVEWHVLLRRHNPPVWRNGA